MLGILGGMGPLATTDFLVKLINATPAERDEDHIPVIVYSVPQIPDRPAAILHGKQSPLQAMLTGVNALKTVGAHAIAIACNTAYHWHAELEREGGVRILHIADAACVEIAAQVRPGAKVGLLATNGTLAAGFYQQRLQARGYTVLVTTPADQERFVLPAIADVKRNALPAAGANAAMAIQQLTGAGAQVILLACTELPVAIDRCGQTFSVPCVDATAALARACVRWWME